MSKPISQHYRSSGRQQGIAPEVLRNAVAAIERVRATDPRITPVLTLRHLADLTDIPYRYLRQVVARRAALGYRQFHLRKRVPGRSRSRLICIPPKSLKSLQSWIVENVLQYVSPHHASYAFHPGSQPILAAEEHCNCDFLLKVDIEDFFHSVSEGRVAKVFEDIGFQKLISFELARLVTLPGDKIHLASDLDTNWPVIPFYHYTHEGFLPQGAPSSPMLANLVMRRADEELFELATQAGFRYTRYADDLAFSSRTGSSTSLNEMRRFRTRVLEVLKCYGFSPNLRKTVIRGPGSRRIVLGMLVDGSQPRLTSEFKDNLRLHLHYLSSPKYGPATHAKARKTGVSSLYYHIRGLISWAQCVEPDYAAKILDRFEDVRWPPIQPR